MRGQGKLRRDLSHAIGDDQRCACEASIPLFGLRDELSKLRVAWLLDGANSYALPCEQTSERSDGRRLADPVRPVDGYEHCTAAGDGHTSASTSPIAPLAMTAAGHPLPQLAFAEHPAQDGVAPTL